MNTYVCAWGTVDRFNSSCRYHNMSRPHDSPKNMDIFFHNHETMITFAHIMKPKELSIYYHLARGLCADPQLSRPRPQALSMVCMHGSRPEQSSLPDPSVLCTWHQLPAHASASHLHSAEGLPAVLGSVH